MPDLLLVQGGLNDAVQSIWLSNVKLLRAAWYQPPMMSQPTGQSSPSTPPIIWVQGEEGAKAYMVAAGNSVLLMDSENSAFYIKSTDASGMPLPLRAFDYKERTTAWRGVCHPGGV